MVMCIAMDVDAHAQSLKSTTYVPMACLASQHSKTAGCFAFHATLRKQSRM